MHTCPNCGYCPHCGRSDRKYPYLPYPHRPYGPYWYGGNYSKNYQTSVKFDDSKTINC